MAQAFRRRMLVQPDGRVEFQDSRLPTGARVEVIVILEEDKPRSAEGLAIDRLSELDCPSQWVTVMESEQEIDETAVPRSRAPRGNANEVLERPI